MNLSDKTFDALAESDVRALIGKEESNYVEYKEAAYPTNDEGTRELLRDVTSFSNSNGGWIVIGIKEDKATNKASDIMHITNADDEIGRMNNILLSSIQERIPGIRIKKITVSDTTSKDVLIVYIPRSMNAPHMITYKGLNQFWKRYETRKDRMTVDEIKDAIIKNERLLEDTEAFIEKRCEYIKQAIKDRTYIALLATPIHRVEQGVAVDDHAIQDVLLKNPAYLKDYPKRHAGWCVQANRVELKPSLAGIASDAHGRRLELYRTGHLEAWIAVEGKMIHSVKDSQGKPYKALHPYALCEFPLSFIYLKNTLDRSVLNADEYIVTAVLYNLDGLSILRSFDGYPPPAEYRMAEYGDNNILLPSLRTNSEIDPNLTAKRVIDRLYQSFGVWEAPLFKEGERRFDFGA